MKKLHELTLGAAFTLLALSACDNEALLPDTPQMNEPDSPNECVLVGDDFRWEGSLSRTALTIEDNVAKFSWTTGDYVGILPDEGAQVYFTIPEPEEGVELTDEQRRRASFDGGAWALKAESNYAAYYPFVKDFDLPRTAVPVNYTGQVQVGNDNAAHLGAYDYMGARPVTTNADGGGVTFDFDHVGALVLLSFTVPEAGTDLKRVTLSADGAEFITWGTYDLTSAKEVGFPITATETSKIMTISLDHLTTTDNEAVTLYFMCAPIDLSGKTVNVSVVYGEGESADTLDLLAAGKKLEAANGYALTAVMGNITDPTQAVKGDYAMKDGSFIKYSAEKTLTDAQKANVAGIVFWTTADSNTSGTTPAKLTDDAIMAADFPNCTHGLIVSLKNVSTGTRWQSTSTNISDWQSDSFAAENKSAYKSIASAFQATDPINYILGYQNTKLLKVYNASLPDASNYKVLPVSSLAEFSTTNPAPAHTTGWFIPSLKELTLLNGGDTDNVGEFSFGSTTIELMNQILKGLGSNHATAISTNIPYWSSTEYMIDKTKAFALTFGSVYFSYYSIATNNNVRAVCAY